MFPEAVLLSRMDEKDLRKHCAAGTVLFARDSSWMREVLGRLDFGTKDGKRVSIIISIDHSNTLFQIILLDEEETEVGEGFRLFISSPSTNNGLYLDKWKFMNLNMDYR